MTSVGAAESAKEDEEEELPDCCCSGWAAVASLSRIRRKRVNALRSPAFGRKEINDEEHELQNLL